MGCMKSKTAGEPPSVPGKEEIATPATSASSTVAGAGLETSSKKIDDGGTTTPSGQPSAALGRKVTFSPQGSSLIDVSVPGQAHSLQALCWEGASWGTEEISASGKLNGVCFRVSRNHIMVGLKADASNTTDSYSDLDYAFYCMCHGLIQVYELGAVMHTLSETFTEDTKFKIHIVDKTVEYLIDEKVSYVSKTPLEQSLHVQIAWNSHPSVVTDIRYIDHSANGVSTNVEN